MDQKVKTAIKQMFASIEEVKDQVKTSYLIDTDKTPFNQYVRQLLASTAGLVAVGENLPEPKTSAEAWALLEKIIFE
jgi:hypothetical protein